MNYYIDFDNTLYNTPLLTERMLNAIVQSACSQKDLNEQELLSECKAMFNREHIYNIYELAEYFSDKYSLDKDKVINNLNTVILNGEDLVFADSVEFLQKLRNQNHNLFLLTHATDNKMQAAKVFGSGLASFFDGLYITTESKYDIGIDYENGIFIDDNPKDLIGLYSKNPKKLIRLRRAENKYSVKDMDSDINIDEYPDFTQIEI